MPNFETMRIRYRKTGNLQYISHLDLQRTWMRVLTRAKIPMWYTQGFNPHPKLNYGCPLPVGRKVNANIWTSESIGQLCRRKLKNS